jgi:hypothetical protein
VLDGEFYHCRNRTLHISTLQFLDREARVLFGDRNPLLSLF